jgi:hypothetical protein
MPNATYRIEMYDPACGDENNPACYFGARVVQTAKFGDVVPPYAVGNLGVQPDFLDISAEVNKFLAAPGAPIKAIAHLVPNTPRSGSPIDFKTIAAGVNAFLGVAYTSIADISGPCACPSGIACNAACNLDNDCPGGVCFNGFCADACGRCSP